MQVFSSKLTRQTHGPSIQWRAHSGARFFIAFDDDALTARDQTSQRPSGRIATLGSLLVEGKGAEPDSLQRPTATAAACAASIASQESMARPLPATFGSITDNIWLRHGQECVVVIVVSAVVDFVRCAEHARSPCGVRGAPRRSPNFNTKKTTLDAVRRPRAPNAKFMILNR